MKKLIASILITLFCFVIESKAQTGFNTSSNVDGSYSLFKRLSPTNNVGNRWEPYWIDPTGDSLTLRFKHIHFDSIPTISDGVPSGKMMWIKTNGRLGATSMSVMTFPYSQLTGTPSIPAQLSGTGFVKTTGTVVTYDNSTYLTAEVDASITNEIQTLSGTGTQTISLSGGGTFVIPTQTAVLTSAQVTTALGAVPLFSEVDGSTSNEIQTVSGTGTRTLTLSNSGGTWVMPAPTSNTVSRSFNSSFTISVTENFRVDYSIYSQVTSALTGTNIAESFLEVSTTSGGTYTTLASGGVMASGVLSSNGSTSLLSGFIPIGYWVRIRTAATGANSGAAVFTYKYGRENNE